MNTSKETFVERMLIGALLFGGLVMGSLSAIFIHYGTLYPGLTTIEFILNLPVLFISTSIFSIVWSFVLAAVVQAAIEFLTIIRSVIPA